MDTRLPSVAYECRDDLHDTAGRQQTPEGMGSWAAKSGAVAGVDRGDIVMGAVADECGAVGCIRAEPSEMEQVIFTAAIWRAFAQCFLTYDEAVKAINDYGKLRIGVALTKQERMKL